MSPSVTANERSGLIDLLTINETLENEKELIEIVEQATKYFPKGTWETIEYLGNLSLKHDVKIASKGRIYGAFLFERLIQKIKKLKVAFKRFELLLGVTSDPVVTIYYRFEGGAYERIVNVVHDYVSEDVGIVSFFRAKGELAKKLVAHGLGHNRGLRHHMTPVDVMYVDLLNYPMLDKKVFCRECIDKLRRID
ncbi:MAG: hypothetical protein QXE76_02340 [Candidatus Bathyarchaeia archaeon]